MVCYLNWIGLTQLDLSENRGLVNVRESCDRSRCFSPWLDPKSQSSKPSPAPACTNGRPLDIQARPPLRTPAAALIEPGTAPEEAGILLQHNRRVRRDRIRDSDSWETCRNSKSINCHEISGYLARPIWRENIARLDDPSNWDWIPIRSSSFLPYFLILNVLSLTSARVQPWYYYTPPTSFLIEACQYFEAPIDLVALLDITTLILKLSQVCERQTAQAKKVAMTDQKRSPSCQNF